jgi:hypothetical protein
VEDLEELSASHSGRQRYSDSSVLVPNDLCLLEIDETVHEVGEEVDSS